MRAWMGGCVDNNNNQYVQAIDHDGGGEMDVKELETALLVSGYGKRKGQSATEVATEMFSKVGVPLDGTIRFNEFVRCFLSLCCEICF